jgi:hypothetical protein
MLYKISFSFHGACIACFKASDALGRIDWHFRLFNAGFIQGDPGLAVTKSFSPKWPGLVLSAATDANVQQCRCN